MNELRHPSRPYLWLKYTALAVASLVLAACGRSQQAMPEQESAMAPATAQTAPSTQDDDTGIEAALSNADRLAADREQDAWRNPAQVLGFLALQPGMQVIDYLAGGGYYSELMSYVVGPEGQVIAYNNAPYLKYAGDVPAQRYGNDRLPNVRQLTAAPQELELDPASLDAALFVQSYHDLHWSSQDGSWPASDPAQSLARLIPALKSGAMVVVVDHVAGEGLDPAVSVDTLHRIDPAIIKRDFEAAGLVFDGESDAFRNPQDDHTKPVFDPSIRHQTDQVIYRFRKP